MTAKKKKSSTEESSTQARPRMLLMAVVLGAAASTWYWYRPLPGSSSFDSSNDSVADRFFETQDTLIEPNTNDSAASNASVVPVYSALPEDLVGDRQVELRPFQPIAQGTLQERLSKEPLPVLPISRPDRTRPDRAAELAAARPPLWTNMESGIDSQGKSLFAASDAKSTDWESTSPWKSAAVASAPQSHIQGDRIVAIGSPTSPVANGSAPGWPDKSFNPQSQLAQSNPLQDPASDSRAPNPPLTFRRASNNDVAKSADRQSGKIVLSENPSEERRESMPRRSIPTAWTSGPQDRLDSTPAVKRSGAVIRQPKP